MPPKPQQNPSKVDIEGSKKEPSMSLRVSRPIDFIRSPRLGPQRPMVFLAHRGASERAPENTIAAFLAANQLFRAAKEKAQSDITCGYEFDILPTRANAQGKRAIVVHHDEQIGRTSRGELAKKRKKPLVQDLSLEELRTLNAGSWKSSLYQNEKIPTLAQVIDVAEQDTFLDIEVKRKGLSETSDGFEEVVLDELEALQLRNRCLIHSFDWGFVQRFKELVAKRSLLSFYAVGLCFEAKDREPRRYWTDRVGPDVIVMQKASGMKKEIAEFQQQGRKVLVWTVNTIKDIVGCANANADGVISNCPELLTDPKFPAAVLQRFRV